MGCIIQITLGLLKYSTDQIHKLNLNVNTDNNTTDKLEYTYCLKNIKLFLYFYIYIEISDLVEYTAGYFVSFDMNL